MPDPASRRRRSSSSPPPARGGGTGGGPLPTAALAIGVVVAGLGIGALISAFQNRGTLPQLGATSVPAVTPVPQPTMPSPLPTLAPAPTASPAPAASPTPAPVPPATASPQVRSATASPAPVPTPALPSAPPPATPRPTPSVKPSTPPTPAAVPTVRAALAPPPTDPGLALVRRYLLSLIAGNETAAYAALGGESSDRNLDLKEEAFLDKDARITSMHVSRSDAAGETIDAEIASGSGSYVATYRITNGPNGPTIAQHDFIKV